MMKHIVIKQPPLAIGSGVKLIHIYTTESLRQRRWLFANFVLTQVIMQQAARESSSGIPSKVRRPSINP